MEVRHRVKKFDGAICHGYFVYFMQPGFSPRLNATEPFAIASELTEKVNDHNFKSALPMTDAMALFREQESRPL